MCRRTVCVLEDIGNKPCLMCVVERSDGELELVGEPNERVEIDGFVAMRLYLPRFVRKSQVG